MEIRAITIGTNVDWDGTTIHLDPAVPTLLDSAQVRFADAGLAVQSARLAMQPFPRVVDADRDAVGALAHALEQAAGEAGFGFSALGPARAGDLEYLPFLIDALVETDNVFGSVVVADRESGISFPAIAAAAETIAALGTRTAGGFGNLRFAALANCPPEIPFFPAGYHSGGPTVFGLAWEAADLAVDAFTTAGTIDEARARLRELIEREGKHVAALATLLAEQHEIRFTGIDLSLAPFPERSRSIGEAFERLGVDVFGAAGTLYVAALITEVLREVDLPRTGFSGLMLPVLEDPVLAERAAQGAYTVHELLLYSAVCGLGLDVVPLPGDVGPQELRGLILDVATLATRLDKPLTARLMPIPGTAAGEPTDFHFPYFVNAVAMPVRGHGAARLFAREGL